MSHDALPPFLGRLLLLLLLLSRTQRRLAPVPFSRLYLLLQWCCIRGGTFLGEERSVHL